MDIDIDRFEGAGNERALWAMKRIGGSVNKGA